MTTIMGDNERRIILVGKTGNGKSSTGNLILHTTKPFEVKRCIKSVTKECTAKKEYRADMSILYKVVDTPGLFDTDLPFVSYATEIHSSIEKYPNPHAFLLVFSTRNRLSPEEKNTIDALKIIFCDTFCQHAIIVFTAGNDINNDVDFKEFLKGDETLTQLIKDCNNRVVTVDSMVGETHTDDLLKLIDAVSVCGKKNYHDEDQIMRKDVFQQAMKKFEGQFDFSLTDQITAISAMFETRHAQELKEIKERNEKMKRENLESNARIERENIESKAKIERENMESKARIERENMESKARIERENKERNEKIIGVVTNTAKAVTTAALGKRILAAGSEVITSAAGDVFSSLQPEGFKALMVKLNTNQIPSMLAPMQMSSSYHGISPNFLPNFSWNYPRYFQQTFPGISPKLPI